MSRIPRADKASFPDGSYQWTGAKAGYFIDFLAKLGRVDDAANIVGMSRQSAYRLRRRLGEGSTFARAWDAAVIAAKAARRDRKKVTRLPPERDTYGLGK